MDTGEVPLWQLRLGVWPSTLNMGDLERENLLKIFFCLKIFL
jgi:hypothetical protein